MTAACWKRAGSAVGVRPDAGAARAWTPRSSRGEIVAVLGENGSGKSTLLKSSPASSRRERGDSRFEGRPLASLPRRETARRIAYVPQSVDLVFPIRSLDLVLQGRAPHGRGFVAESAADRRLALEAMRACDVEALAERDASALSGGERRRVFLARALAQEAEIWLLDEPTAGLDPRHRLEFLETLLAGPPGAEDDGPPRHARDRAWLPIWPTACPVAQGRADDRAGTAARGADAREPEPGLRGALHGPRRPLRGRERRPAAAAGDS